MSLGLPIHLEPVAISRGFARGSHVVALVCLVSALVCILSIQAASPSLVLWPAAIALVPMFLLLWFLDRTATVFATAAYLVVGAGGVFLYVYAATAQIPNGSTTDNLLLTLPKLALIMVGWPGVGRWQSIAACLSGYLLAEGATTLAAQQTGSRVVLDSTSLLITIIIVVVLAFIAVNGHAAQSAKPSLHRAARDEYLSDLRFRVEGQAAAVLHDTVLNHLAAIASAPSGGIATVLREQIAHDLEVIVGEEWLLETEADTAGAVDLAWAGSRLARVIDENRQHGLEIEVSGDRSAIARLSAARATAVALAAGQCLANVAKHSGTHRAEVVIFGAELDVSIMVIDAGKGFSVAETGNDRLGISQSIHRRIEAVGGSAQLWSTPGRGTSVLMRVPAGAVASDIGPSASQEEQ